MDVRQVVFGSLVLLAAALNFAFFVGDLSDPAVHEAEFLFAALLVNLIATAFKFGDRTHLGAVHLSATLVADVQLLAAAVVWAHPGRSAGRGLQGQVTGEVLSLSGGALMASIVLVVLLVLRTISGATATR